MPGGHDLQWYGPYRAESEETSEAAYNENQNTVGHHTSAYAALNIKNAQPNTHYYWAHAKDQNELVRLQQVGYRVITKDDPEYSEANNVPGLSNHDGTALVHGDVVAMKISGEDYATYQKQLLEQRTNTPASRTEAFIEQGVQRVQELAPDARPTAGPAYYVKEGHRSWSD